MKLHITRKQFNELSLKGKEKLVDWLKTRKWDTLEKNAAPLLNIGQMIEFLDEHFKFRLGWVLLEASKAEIDCGEIIVHKKPNVKKLCDALWQAVKEILEK